MGAMCGSALPYPLTTKRDFVEHELPAARTSQLHQPAAAFPTRVLARACAGRAPPTSGRGVHPGERAQAAWRAAVRRGRPAAATVRVAILPISLGMYDFRALGLAMYVPRRVFSTSGRALHSLE